jgi:isopenicillin N synthase-like dioxygenase
MKIPTIDIAAFLDPQAPAEQRAAVSAQWNQAFSTIGFANIVGHGVPLPLIKSVQREALGFFDLPLDEKRRCSLPGEKRSQGYYQVGLETVNKTFDGDASAAPPDLVETLSFAFVDWGDEGPRSAFERSIFHPNIWPTQPAGLRELLHDYYLRVYRVAQVLMEISAAALRLPPGFFDPYFARMASTLRLAHYPDQEVEPLPGQFRYGAHTDYLGFTLLLQDDAPGGLQVLDEHNGWVDALPVEGAFTVNCGDLMSRWTNGCWKSNIHRVINPPRALTGSSRRLSVVMFTGPDYESEIRCLPSCESAQQPARFAPIRCWDHFLEKVRASLD